MKKCIKCGYELEDKAKFCIICGEKQPEEENIDDNSLQKQQDENEVIADIDKSTEESLTSPIDDTAFKDIPDLSFAHLYPMNWYKFIIYFQLFLNALLNIVSALRYFTGDIYGDDAKAVYSAFKGLQAWDILYGILLVLLAVFALKARRDLAKFKSGAPGVYYALIVANSFLTLIFNYIRLDLGNIPIDNSTLTRSLIGIVFSIVYVIFNKKYFDKRDYMFNK